MSVLIRRELYGWTVCTSDYMTQTVLVEEPRTWRERLWSWPWRPWLARKWVTTEGPRDDCVVDLATRTIFCHPSRLWEIERILANGALGLWDWKPPDGFSV